jgi:hypothetical protein
LVELVNRQPVQLADVNTRCRKGKDNDNH